MQIEITEDQRKTLMSAVNRLETSTVNDELKAKLRSSKILLIKGLRDTAAGCGYELSLKTAKVIADELCGDLPVDLIWQAAKNYTNENIT